MTADLFDPGLIPAISHRQPWASLVAVEAKANETRSWRFPIGLQGQTIAIHAAKRPAPVLDPVVEAAVRLVLGDHWRRELPRGAVVATATLAACVRSEDAAPDELEALFGNYDPGRFAWRLENVAALEPFAVSGRQGWFKVAIPLPERSRE